MNLPFGFSLALAVPAEGRMISVPLEAQGRKRVPRRRGLRPDWLIGFLSIRVDESQTAFQFNRPALAAKFELEHAAHARRAS